MFKENFTRRHIGPKSSDLNKILSTIGVNSVEQLLNQTIPEKIRLKKDLNIPEGISEMEFLKEIKKLSYRIQDETLKKYVLEDFLEKIKNLTPNQSYIKNYNHSKFKKFQ